VKHFVLAATVAALLAAAAGPAMAQASGSAAVRKLDMSAVRDLDRDNVRIVQSALQRRGFDPGPIDGIVGPLTRAAVRKFQDHYGMEAQGQIDNQLLFALGDVEAALSH
jgi:membrane-bound lytic murein transglycosylase B